MSIADKIRSVLSIKAAIKTAIAGKGVAINDVTPFSDYPAKIQSIVVLDPALGGAEYTVTATAVTLFKLTLPSTVKRLQQNAFSIPAIKELVIQEGLTQIDGNALSGMSGLERITLPTTLTTVLGGAFSSNGLLEIKFNSNANLNACTYFAQSCPRLTKIDISSCIATTQLPSSFAYNSPLVNTIILPPSITELGVYSLDAVTGLKNINLDNIILINQYAFRSCGLQRIEAISAKTLEGGALTYSLCRSLILPKIVTIQALGQCYYLTYVEIGEFCTSINGAGFKDTPLVACVIKATTPPTVGFNAFATNNSNLKIYVPDAVVATYKTTGLWTNFAAFIYPMSQFVMPVLP